MTANLQKITVKQTAQIMNVSERSVYMAKKVSELRPDLEVEIMAGRMSLHKAHQIATGKPAQKQKRCPHCGEALK